MGNIQVLAAKIFGRRGGNHRLTPEISAVAGGTVSAHTQNMYNEHIETLTGRDGHTAVIAYTLAATGGWDVRAQLDGRTIAMRHCIEWHGVERLYFWLRLQIQ
jgi:hypothetical protein